MEGADGSREREAAELLKVLGEPDAIYMPTASDTLKDYLKLGQAVRFFWAFLFFCVHLASHAALLSLRTLCAL